MSATDTTPQQRAEPNENAELSFEALPLSDELRRALRDMRYEQPTPVQVAVWESTTSGRDVVVQARTGTGKTAAFGMPLIDKLVRRSKKRAQALILCPTRELALQVSRELEELSAHREVSIIAVYGGAPMGRQIDAIAAGAQIVVGTPGRVLDHLRRGTLESSAMRALVLDEADEMLSMGFERELSAIIEHLPTNRQTMLFSATVPPDIERMARTRLREPEFIILSGDHVGALEVDHFVYWVPEDKPSALLQVIEVEDPESAIVFCNTKEQTERIAARLKREGFDADWLNGDLPQSEREKVMRATRERRLRFLVATDVAARGIDISHLTHVINCDFPKDAEAYVHRTGRTGRAGNTGVALSLATPQDIGALYILRLTYKIRPLERQLPSARDQRTRREADIVSSLAETFAQRGQSAEHLALAQRLLTHDDAEAILAGMLGEHLGARPELPEVAQSRRRARKPAMSSKKPPRPASRRRQASAAPTVLEEPTASPAVEPTASPAVEPTAEAPTPAVEPPAPAPKPKKRSASRTKTAPSVDVSQDGLTRSAPSADAAAADPAAADPASAPEPAPAAAPTATKSSRAKTRPDAKGKKAGSEQQQAAAARSTEVDPIAVAAPADHLELVELHLSLGRSDGARVRLIRSILADGGVHAEHVKRIRIRERYCFVEVETSVVEVALEALNEATIEDRSLSATVSTRSRA